MQFSAKDLLERGKEKIEQGWCQGEFAKDCNGLKVDEVTPEAVEWCAMGGFLRAYHELCLSVGEGPEPGAYKVAERSLLMACPMLEGIDCWNDAEGRTQESVVHLYNDAIHLASLQLEGTTVDEDPDIG